MTRPAHHAPGPSQGSFHGASGDHVAHPQLRVARPTDDLDRLLPFYTQGLGLEILYRFEDHEGIDGVMVGRSGWPYHLEFTRQRGHPAGRAPSLDHILVFYLPGENQWRCACRRMSEAGFAPVKAANPYWDRNGRTYEDADGYRVVLYNAAWT